VSVNEISYFVVLSKWSGYVVDKLFNGLQNPSATITRFISISLHAVDIVTSRWPQSGRVNIGAAMAVLVNFDESESNPLIVVILSGQAVLKALLW